MKRTFSQTGTLDVFSVDLDQLLQLWGIILDQFSDCGGVLDSSFVLKVPGRTLEFVDIGDLRSCNELPDKWSNFELSVHGGGRSLRVALDSQISPRATVSAAAGTEGWCGGVIGSIATFLNAYRPWYYWVYRINEGVSLPILLGIGFFAPSLLQILFDALGRTIEFGSFAVTFTALAAGLLVSVMRWFMPRSAVIVALKPGIFERRYREIMFVVAVTTIVVNLLVLLD